MLAFEPIANSPLASLPAGSNPSPPNPTAYTAINSNWRSINGKGYCVSTTLVLQTTDSGISSNSVGVTLEVNAIDIMHEPGGLL